MSTTDKTNQSVPKENSFISCEKSIKSSQNEFISPQKKSETSLAEYNLQKQLFDLTDAKFENKNLSVLTPSLSVASFPAMNSTFLGNPDSSKIRGLTNNKNEYAPSSRSASIASMRKQVVKENCLMHVYSNNSLTSTDLEFSNSNADDVMSLTTTTCDYEQQLCMLTAEDEYNFDTNSENQNTDIETAEEAESIDKRVHWKQFEKKFLSRHVNVFDTILSNTYVLLTIGKNDQGDNDDHEQPAQPNKVKTVISGLVSGVNIFEHFDQLCSEVYVHKSSVYDLNYKMKSLLDSIESNIHAAFNVNISDDAVNVVGNSSVIFLNDEIVSHLGPFAENTEIEIEPPNPPLIEINLSNLRLEIKNPKKRYPVTLRFGSEFSINGGPPK